MALFALAWPAVRRHASARLYAICAFSLFFYGWWDWRYLPLLVGVAAITYLAGWLILRVPRLRGPALCFGLATPLLVLGAYKYSGFFARIAADYSLLSADAIPAFILPLGISFFTFQGLSFVIDVHRGRASVGQGFVHYLAYLSLFAQLVAGPIVRASRLMPQLLGAGNFNAENRWRGLRLVVQGFVKKVVIADNLAPFVNAAFELAPEEGSSALWWCAAVAFGIQIFCDFSGYSDIARGIARWMGYSFDANFRSPYVSRGFREFWSRWHISLSTWFRDYVYIPLGGSRHGTPRTLRNIWVAMLLSGFWHGANWTFLCWGAVHALFVSIEHLSGYPARLRRSGLAGRLAAWAVTFVGVTLAWVFFRAQSVEQAFGILEAMLTFQGGQRPRDVAWFQAAVTAFILFCIGSALAYRWHTTLRALSARTRDAAEVGMLACGIALAVFARGPGSVFIYFQF
jgi:D-alanyl-lipoteichoic acid acyltransferase DltB (MBOAT superfamily)